MYAFGVELNVFKIQELRSSSSGDVDAQESHGF